jgi:RNA-directed DNA polymerase
MYKSKPFEIPKKQVLEAFKLVKANRGSGGVDGQSIEDFETNFKDNQYKVWNRMSSGSYFPETVKGVEIPKKTGGTRLLGIPTVTDRIAQMVVRLELEPKLEPIFMEDSYGYRPNKSAIDAVRVVRNRCWKYDWLLEFDIKGMFDNIDHELLMKAVETHTNNKWVILYIKRWLKSAIKMPDGVEVKRNSGTPQGGVISPLLCNLFMHYAFDKWMERENPQTPWARYADDGVIHCRTKEEGMKILESLKNRLKECKLEIHPDKTRLVYCKDANRKGEHQHIGFDFLGYTFRPRIARNGSRQYFLAFTPAVSAKACKTFREKIRTIRRQMTTRNLEEVAEAMNPIIRGWANYFGCFNLSQTKQELSKINLSLVRWAVRKYKKLQRHLSRALDWLGLCAKTKPKMFVHWAMGIKPMAR